MTNRTSIRPAVKALALATALALSGSVFAVDNNQGNNINARVDTSGVGAGQTYDRFIVKYRDGTLPFQSAAERGNALARAARSQGVQLGHVRRLAVGADLIEADRAMDGNGAIGLMRALAADPNVEYVEPDLIMRPILTPNDTYYSQYQWDLYESAGGIRANTAWDQTTGTGTVVAVLDTGITTHSDLAANVISGYDFISSSTTARDGNGRDSNPQDEGDWSAANECGSGSPASNSSWHGTHVAGTIGALTNNAKGIAGIAYGAKVQPVRVLGKCGGSTSDIADAMVWASGGAVSGVPSNSTPAEVINLSLGGGGACGSTFQNAINTAVGRGTVIVIAAGNESQNVSNSSPANCANVIAVASTDRNGAKSSFSNYGSLIDVSAPGSTIASTLNAGTTTPGAESYAIYDGTSMAAPHVAAVAALMQAKLAKTPAEVESLLKSTARALPGACSGGCGAGIIDATAALNALTGGGGGGGGSSTLTNGVAVTNISGATGSETRWTMDVPAGASNLTFSSAGGSGDADLYVKFGSAPTTSSYDCRPYLNGNTESCAFASPQTGTYHVMLRAYSTYSGLSLTGSYTAGGGGGGAQTYSNGTNYNILDKQTTNSLITVSGRSGNAGSSVPVAVDIKHTYIGDLRVRLYAPDGSYYTLHNYTGGSADNILQTYNVNLSSEALNGTWKLQVYDNYSGDTGYIDSWSITF